ncbi:MAG: tlde1 domain-containing protein [Pseudomonadota bacterium]
MPWEYSQGSGELRHNGVLVYDKGYSGKGSAKNRPDMEHLKDQGPIPRGSWRIGQPYYSGKVGRFAVPLTPYAHGAYGRKDFLIHGDKHSNLGNASEGCIILPFDIRTRIFASGDNMLDVVR